MIKTILRISAYAFLSLMLWMLGFLSTPFGFQHSLSFAQKYLPGQLRYSHLHGSLLGPIQMQKISYTTESYTLQIEKLHLYWNPLALLLGNVSIHQLNIVHMNIDLHPPITDLSLQKSKKTLAKPLKLPIGLKITQGTLHDFSITQDQKTQLALKTLYLHGLLSESQVQLSAASQFSAPLPVTIHLQLQGNLAHYHALITAEHQNLHWGFTAIGTQNQLDIKTPHPALLNGTLNLNGQLAWFPEKQWSITLLAKQLHLNLIQKTLTPNLNASIHSSQQTLTGHLDGPNIQADISAHFSKVWSAKWSMHIAELSQLDTRLFGQVDSLGSWTGDLKQYQTEGYLNLKQFFCINTAMNTLNSQWKMNNQTAVGSYFTLSAKDIHVDNHPITQISIQSTGNLSNAHWQVNILQDLAEIQLALHSKTVAKKTDIDLNTLTVTHSKMGRWLLAKTAHFQWQNDILTLDQLHLNHIKKGQLILQGQYSPLHAWQCQLDLNQLPTQSIIQGLTENFNVKSVLQLNTKWSGIGNHLQTGTTQATLSSGKVLYLSGTQMLKTPFQGLQFAWHYSVDKSDAQLDLSVNKTDFFKIHFPSISSHQLLGEITLYLNDPSIIGAFIPAINLSQGHLQAALQITGSMQNPKIQGHFNFLNGVMGIQSLGISLQKMQLTLTAVQKILNFTATAYSENSPLTLKGQLNFNHKPLSMKIHLQGHEVKLVNTAEYQVIASPNLDFTLEDEKMQIKGDIHIPTGLLKPHNFYNVVELPLGEMTFIGGQPSQPPSQFHVLPDLTVELGDHVQIDSFGLKGFLTGKLHILESDGQVMMANGRINLEKGKYVAFGQALKMGKDSYIQYIQSPLKNPSLHFSASRRIQAVSNISGQQFSFNTMTVGLNIRGTLKNPKFSLYSQPASLSQSDILSYLVIGTNDSSVSAANVGLLLQASNSLNLSNSSGGIQSQIQQGLGLNELGVESQNTYDAVGNPVQRQNAFVVGRRLANRLYLRYSYGLLIPVNTVQIRYLLNHGFAVQTNASTNGTGGDIIYTLER